MVTAPTLTIRLPGTSIWVDYSDFLVLGNQSGGGIVGGTTVTQLSSLLTDVPCTKVHQLNTPPQLGFVLGPPLGASWTKPPRWSEIRLDTPEYPGFFTGFLTNEPGAEPLGEDIDGTQIVGYHYTAVGEEILLDMNAIGVIPPFVGLLDGQIIAALIAKLSPGVGSPAVFRFDTSGIIGFGLTNPIFTVQPQERFTDVVTRLLANQSVKFWFQRGVVNIARYNDGMVYLCDEDSDPNFGNYDLNCNPVPNSIRNDLTGFGDIEQKEYAREYFVADGVTANWNLKLPVFGSSGTPLFGDDFSATTIDTSHWILNDPTGVFSMFGGSLNIVGGAGLASTSMLLNQGLEMNKKHKLNGGEFQFVGGQDGIVCGLYLSETLSLAQCKFGFRLNPVASPASQSSIQAIVDGNIFGDTVYTQPNKTYAFHIYIDSQVAFRQWRPWWSRKLPFGGGFGNSEFIVTFVVEENDQLQVKAPTRYQIYRATIPGTSTGSPPVPAMPVFLFIGLASVNSMNCSMNFFSVSEPIQAALSLTEPLLLASPPHIGPPPSYGSPPSFTYRRGIMGFVGETDADATIQVANQSDALSFFQETRPVETTLIELSYRGSGAAVARVINQASITSQAAAFGDSGVRSDVLTSILPLPATSEILESALQAYLDDNIDSQFDGDWTVLNPPYASIFDNFLRSNVNPLIAPWTKPSPGGIVNLQLVSDSVEPASTGATGVMYYTTVALADQYAEFVMSVLGTSGDSMGPAVRVTAAGAGYVAKIPGPLGASVTGTIEKLAGGGVLASFSITPKLGDIIHLEAIGTLLRVRQNGNIVATITDATTAFGSPGIQMFAASSVGNASVINFSGGQYAGFAGGEPIPGRFLRVISASRLAAIAQFDGLVQVVQTDIVTCDSGSPATTQFLHKLSYGSLATRRMDQILQRFAKKPPAPELLSYNPSATTIPGVDTTLIPTQFVVDLPDVKLLGIISVGSPAKLQYSLDTNFTLGANQFYEVRWSDANWGQDGVNLIGRFIGSSFAQPTVVPIAGELFNRPDSNPIGGNWSTVFGEAAAKIVGGVVVPVATTSVSYYSRSSFTSDQYCQITLGQLTGGGFSSGASAGAVVRSNGSQQGYMAIFTTAASILVQTLAGSTIAQYFNRDAQGHFLPFSPGDTLRLVVHGSAWFCYYNGVLVLEGTGMTITGGNPGIYVSSNGGAFASIEEFNAGNAFPAADTTDFAIDRVRRDEWIYVKLLDKNFTPWRLSRHPAFVRIVYPMVPPTPILDSIDLTSTKNPIFHFNLGIDGEIADVYQMEVRASDDFTVLATIPIFAVTDLQFPFSNPANLSIFTVYVRLNNLLGEVSGRLEATASTESALLPANSVGSNQITNPGFEISTGAYPTSPAIPANQLIADNWYAAQIVAGDNTFLTYVEKNGNARTGGRNAYITLNRALTSLAGINPGGIAYIGTIGQGPDSWLGSPLGNPDAIAVRGGDMLYYGGWAKWDADSGFGTPLFTGSIASISKSGTTVTVQTSVAYGIVSGTEVTISGTFGWGESYDGSFPDGITVIDSTHFSYQDVSSSPKGTITGHGTVTFPGDAIAYVGFDVTFYDVDGFFITDTLFNNSDPNVSGDQMTAPTNSWVHLSGLTTVPQNAAYAIYSPVVLLAVFNAINPSLHNYLEVRFDDIFCEKANRGVHSDYSIIGNPLTAHDDGTTGSPPVDNLDEIDVATFFISSGGKQVALNSGSILFCQRRTPYYVFYDDPDFSGGAVTYQATEDPVIAKLGESRFFIGSIIGPSLGAPDSIGNGDGGHGSVPVIGTLLAFVPGIPSISASFTQVTTPSGSASVLNAGAVLDNDDTTFATLTVTNSGASPGPTAGINVSTPFGIYRRFSKLTVYVDYEVTVNTVPSTPGFRNFAGVESLVASGTGFNTTGLVNLTIPNSPTLVPRTIAGMSIDPKINAQFLILGLQAFTGGFSGTTTIKIYRVWLRADGG